MHKNNNIKNRNSLQGLRPFSSTIPKGLKNILRKGGYNFSNIVDNWINIVGKKIAARCYPIKVKNNRDFDKGIIFLNVIHGKELEIEYSKKDITDRINSFFGYQLIKDIKLKVIRKDQKLIKRSKNFSNKNSKLKLKLENIKNSELKNNLNKLIKAYDQKNN